MGLFDIFRGRKKKEYELDLDLLKQKILDELGVDISSQIEHLSEKSEYRFDDLLFHIEEVVGRIYVNPTNRLQLCSQIDEFIRENPEVHNSIKYYISYIIHGDIQVKLDDYRVNVITDSKETQEKATKLIQQFEKTSKIKRWIYHLSRDLLLYGDAFIEKIRDKEGKIISCAYIPSNSVLIAVDSFGNVVKIYQIVDPNIKITDLKEVDIISTLINERKVIEFDSHEFIHISDGSLPGLSDSPIRNLVYLWKAYKLIEEALIIHRVTRSRRIMIFFLDVTGKDPTQIKNAVSRFVNKLTSVLRIDISDPKTIYQKSIVKQGSDIVIPITKDSATKVQTIPADASSTKIDDLKFYYDRLLHTLLTAHIFGSSDISRDKSSYLDKAFIRNVRLYQRHLAYALEDLYQEMLESNGIKNVIVDVQFPTPDNTEEIKIVDTIIRRIMVINQLIATLGVTLPHEWIIKYIFKDLTQDEMKELVQLIQQEKEKERSSDMNELINLFSMEPQENESSNELVYYTPDIFINEKTKLLELGIRYLELVNKL